ncbi:UDP-3-O-acyl-N-acetylglucosamine deacetylase [Stappia taiwanensis]|uniref:UDP-3-O-acyl-N-acetylglucosamine deacetylase n=1 Tax=Stappia taiwanensis TaxID=992267 RepID=A0A838XVJ9_9HYPH|nr:UDP-3-O-acyl-N-acetylglucosamine deacetylase [Stappia taiwanensis]MBA4611084.1 UDP-3-O-acyl-N-acetylglucosamine deacetylase [Stappia taiwanensis]GGE85811.1 UDP-3-O-acyl-N-acetylglucosamine deacetylase [Stappia taiwanensis]
MKKYSDRQTTLAGSVPLKGIGVHSGDPAMVTLHPADAGSGIVFVGQDPESRAEVEMPAHWQAVSATALCTVLGDPKAGGVSTVEHLMAALRGLGVDNAIVEMDGPEMPIMDGSAAEFVDAIDQVGLRQLAVPRRYVRVKSTVRVDQGSAWCELRPYDGCRFDVTIDFDTPVIGRQNLVMDLTPDRFRRDLARARTFGSVQDVEKLWSMGFALGSSLENSVAISEDRILNPEGTRWPDEFVRHKMLDAVGDLALAGLPILGEYRSYKGGHRMNHSILVELFERAGADAFEIVEAPFEREAGAVKAPVKAMAAAVGQSPS